MNNRYLEICSAYRNRNLFPYPAEFEIEISQSGTKNKYTALDPISDAAPKNVFNGSFLNNINNPTLTINSIYTNTVGNTSDQTIFVIETPLGSLRTERDFYEGASIKLVNGANIARRRIDSYEFLTTNPIILNHDLGLITVTTNIPDIFFQPGTTGEITNPTDTTLSNNPAVFIPYAEFIENFYINCYIENVDQNESRNIIYYDGFTHLAVLDSIAPTWNSYDNYIIRKLPPCNIGTLTVVTSSSKMNLELNAANTDDYIGGFLRIAGPLPVLPFSTIIPPYNECRRIVNYNGVTKEVTVYPPFSVTPGLVKYEVLCFTIDNANPFVYTGSMVSQQESVCYEIELVDLILPNVVLSSGKGGRIAFYPYVYVELQNVSGSNAGTKNIIYSNNPNSTRMLFRCAVDDISNQRSSPFLKIDSDGTKQTIKWKINDNLKFSVILPTGELFKTTKSDDFGPLPANELLQVSALFSIKRL
jgi:hypothetical protein